MGWLSETERRDQYGAPPVFLLVPDLGLAVRKRLIGIESVAKDLDLWIQHESEPQIESPTLQWIASLAEHHAYGEGVYEIVLARLDSDEGPLAMHVEGLVAERLVVAIAVVGLEEKSRGVAIRTDPGQLEE